MYSTNYPLRGYISRFGLAGAVEFPVLYHEKSVRVPGEPAVVGDHDDCAVLRDHPDRLQEPVGGDRVQACGGFVQDQHGSVAQERTGEADALALAAGESAAALTGDRVVAVRQRGDEGMRARRGGGPYDVLVSLSCGRA